MKITSLFRSLSYVIAVYLKLAIHFEIPPILIIKVKDSFVSQLYKEQKL